MARCEHLPIYKAALDMTLHFEKLVAGFSRYHRYTLGTELCEASRGVLMQVLRANNAGSREQSAAELLVLRDRIDALLLQLPLGPAPVAEANDGLLALTVGTPAGRDRLLKLHS